MSAIIGGAIAAGGAIAGGIGGAAIGAAGARDAAATQAAAANHATDVQQQEYQQQQQNQKPFLAAGGQAITTLSNLDQAGAPTFSKQDFLNNQDPGYQFNLEQGQQAIERSAAARGGLMSGGTLKDLTSYSQGQASNEYNNAYNRFMNGQNTQFNRLAAVAGIGQTANGQIGQAGSNMANNVSNIGMSSGNAAAASQIAQNNVWGGTLSSLGSGIGNNFSSGMMTNGILNRMYPQGGGGGVAGGGGGGGGGGSGWGSEGGWVDF